MKFASVGYLAVLGYSAASALNLAAVYDLPRNQHSQPLPSASLEDTILYIADKVGVSDFYELGDAPEIAEFLNSAHHAHAAKPKLVAVVKGVEQPSTLYGNAGFEVAIEHKKLANVLSRALLSHIPSQVAASLGSAAIKLTDEISAVSTNGTAAKALLKHFRHFNDILAHKWKSFVGGAADDAQQVFEKADPNVAYLSDKVFMSELMQIHRLGESEAADFVVLDLHSLLSVGQKVGFNSQTYDVAKRTLSRSLETLAQTYDVTVLALAPKVKSEAESLHLHKRNQQLEQVFAVFNKRGAAGSNSCFLDEEACHASTNSCNSHGSCTKVLSKCWQCLCKPSYDKETSKTTVWTGFDCSKKDVSAQAHLLLWTTVTIVAAAVAGIKLLYAIGEETLPGVLEAATARKST